MKLEKNLAWDFSMWDQQTKHELGNKFKQTGETASVNESRSGPLFLSRE